MDIDEIGKLIESAAQSDEWVQDEKYSVFAQRDAHYYLKKKEQFEHKYRTFKAITNILRPATIIELGTHAGSGAEAYLSGVGYDAHYTGYDSFGIARFDDGFDWDPRQRCIDMFRDRDYDAYKLIQCDLRDVREIPYADLIVVDAGHDYRNAYQDLLLALRSKPLYIHMDDYNGEDAQNAVRDILMNYPNLIEGMTRIDQWSGSALLEVSQ